MDQTHASEDEPPDGAIKTAIYNLEEAIFKRRPIFGEIMRKHGGKSLFEYTKEFWDIKNHNIFEDRRLIFFNIIRKELESRLGNIISVEAVEQLAKTPLVSTADHHGFIDHPFWVNSNIITALPYPEANESTLKHIIVFSFSSVSLNNASAFPRGIIVHGGEEGEGALLRIPLLPDKWKMRTVYGTPAYTKNDLERGISLIWKKYKEGQLSRSRAFYIAEFVSDTFGSESLLESKDLSSQITKANYLMWPGFFSGNSMPNLIYLEAETITRELFLQAIFKTQDSILYKMLFDESIRALALKYFNGIPGAFSRDNNWGTFFFWALDAKGHRVRLTLDNGSLISRDKDLNFELTPEVITDALIKKQIFPSMMSVYLTIALHYGFKCLGGFSQVHDLTKMKEALLQILVEIKDFSEVQAVSRIQTKELGGDGMALAYIKNKEGCLTPATGIDLLLTDKKLSYQEYRALSKRVTLREMLMPLLPEIYSVLYSSYERNGLGNLTAESIIQASGLEAKFINSVMQIFPKQELIASGV